MAAKITNPWKSSRQTSAETQQRKEDRLIAAIAHAEQVLAWQIEEGYEQQAEISRVHIAKLNKQLAKARQ